MEAGVSFIDKPGELIGYLIREQEPWFLLVGGGGYGTSSPTSTLAALESVFDFYGTHFQEEMLELTYRPSVKQTVVHTAKVEEYAFEVMRLKIACWLHSGVNAVASCAALTRKDRKRFVDIANRRGVKPICAFVCNDPSYSQELPTLAEGFEQVFILKE